MKNKKGFTLLELLAVIVILAIIALIAVPIILNMIENAKKSAAIDSTYGYIEAVENYQAYEMLKGNTGLKEGVYEITEDKTVDNVKYPKLKGLIKLKGNAPTFGNVGITKNGTVGTANLCVNNYLVTYQNNKAEILSGGCENLGITLTYNISSEEWEASKTLEILYPEGKYEYYYKLESGNAKVGEKELVVGEEIKVETNTVSIEILENSKITAWMVKDGKKLSLRTYEETKIDNVEIGTIKVATTASYPTLTQYGVELKTTLTLEYEEQEGTSAYYSADNGETWKKYINSTEVSGTSIQAKLVRDKSKREGEIVTSKVSTASDALGSEAYDKDETTGICSKGYVNIDSSMIGKGLSMKSSPHRSDYPITVTFYNGTTKNGSKNLTSSTTLSTKIIDIPENTTRMYLSNLHCNTGATANGRTYEIAPYNLPVYTIEQVYPKLTSYGVEKGYDYITINYFDTSKYKKYYIGENGTVKDYEDKKIKVNTGETIFMYGVDEKGVKTTEVSYTSALPADALGELAYDNDESTGVCSEKGLYIDIDDSMLGKDISMRSIPHRSDYPIELILYKSDGTSSLKKNITASTVKETSILTIPTDAVKMRIRGVACRPTQTGTGNVYEFYPVE